MNVQCFGPLSEDAICKLESALGVTLPGNYREFLKERIIKLWLRRLGRQSLWMYSSGMA